MFDATLTPTALRTDRKAGGSSTMQQVACGLLSEGGAEETGGGLQWPPCFPESADVCRVMPCAVDSHRHRSPMSRLQGPGPAPRTSSRLIAGAFGVLSEAFRKPRSLRFALARGRGGSPLKQLLGPSCRPRQGMHWRVGSWQLLVTPVAVPWNLTVRTPPLMLRSRCHCPSNQCMTYLRNC